MTTPALSIVIVSYNARQVLEGCLQSLSDAPPSISHEIVVVDNASSDGSPEAAGRWSSVRVIPAGSNLGFSAASNLGIRATTGDLLLLLNSDTVVPPGAIDALVATLRQHPDVAVVGPRLLNGDRQPELSFGRMISPLSEFQQRRLMKAVERGDALTLSRIDTMTREEQRPDWVSGACLLVRRADAEAVGLLDERYFMYTEDVDFCAAIRARGRHILFSPEIEVVHLKGRSVASAPEATRAAYERSHLAFYEKHHPRLVPFLRLFRRLT
ncbi:MAG: glycosyltransferase family 2 protein [Vicinamibacterales bacterium]